MGLFFGAAVVALVRQSAPTLNEGPAASLSNKVRAQEDGVAASEQPSYVQISSGRCDTSGHAYLTTIAECQQAASYLMKPDTLAGGDGLTTGSAGRPPYCYYKPSNYGHHQDLWFLTGANTGDCTVLRQCLCRLVTPTPASTPAPTPFSSDATASPTPEASPLPSPTCASISASNPSVVEQQYRRQ